MTSLWHRLGVGLEKIIISELKNWTVTAIRVITQSSLQDLVR